MFELLDALMDEPTEVLVSETQSVETVVDTHEVSEYLMEEVGTI